MVWQILGIITLPPDQPDQKLHIDITQPRRHPVTCNVALVFLLPSNRRMLLKIAHNAQYAALKAQLSHSI